MSRLLVVHEYMHPGGPHDQQRGRMYADLLRAGGIEARFIGRRPLPGVLADRLPSAASRRLRTSLEYRAWDRVVASATGTVSDERIVRAAREVDVVLFVATDSASLVHRVRAASGARLVYDLVDVRFRQTPELMRRVADIVSTVDAVTCDNTFSMRWARELNGDVYHWPSASYIEAFDAARPGSRRGAQGHVRVGWIGTHSTASNLFLILESLEDVFRAREGLELRLLGPHEDHDLLSRFERVAPSVRTRYDSADMVREVLDMDIGLFPMYDVDDSAMHGVTKALIYMAGGAAALCSPVGDVTGLVHDGENGLCASGRQEWTEKLMTLVDDGALRTRLADAGRTTAQCYSLERCFRDLRAALRL
ncbi:MAG: glycosyltransferase family 4 protein [Chloroflexota bacterium]|nr:glycosyltransferase family 4 protein [Chloroflexota bacterium]